MQPASCGWHSQPTTITVERDDRAGEKVVHAPTVDTVAPTAHSAVAANTIGDQRVTVVGHQQRTNYRRASRRRTLPLTVAVSWIATAAAAKLVGVGLEAVHDRHAPPLKCDDQAG